MDENIEKVKKILEKQKYAFVGNHSGVQICRWTRNSLLGKGVCWKEKFYGVKSHQCCEMSPAVMWCENSCLHCWRPIELNLGTELPVVDNPKEIIDGIVEARKKLLIGYKGIISKKKWEEAINPTLFTFSLSGEATIYPRLRELIQEVRKRKAVSFLVTNGLNPKKIKELVETDSLPTQIALSTNAPNEKLFTIWHRSSRKDAWKRFNETLDLLKNLKGKTRRVIRLTLAKKGEDKKAKFNEISNMEDENVKEYADLIRKSEPDFIHVKGFMSVGYSRERMGYDKMPWHKEIKVFAKKLQEELKKDSYKILAEEKRSCVVVLGKNKKDMKIKEI